MENVAIKSPILEEKLQSFGNEKMKNFVADGELTVTITLSEYRELVAGIATKDADIKSANDNKYIREQENRKLIEENAALKAEIYEMKKEVDRLGKETEAL